MSHPPDTDRYVATLENWKRHERARSLTPGGRPARAEVKLSLAAAFVLFVGLALVAVDQHRDQRPDADQRASDARSDVIARGSHEENRLFVHSSLAAPRQLPKDGHGQSTDGPDDAAASDAARDDDRLGGASPGLLPSNATSNGDPVPLDTEEGAQISASNGPHGRALSTVSGGGCHQVLVHDWNADGRDDLILALAEHRGTRGERNEVVWLENLGPRAIAPYARPQTLLSWSTNRTARDLFVVLRTGELPPTGARWRIDARDATGDGLDDLLVVDGYRGVLVLQNALERRPDLRVELNGVRTAEAERDLFWTRSDWESEAAHRELERLEEAIEQATEALREEADASGGMRGTTWVLEREQP